MGAEARVRLGDRHTGVAMLDVVVRVSYMIA